MRVSYNLVLGLILGISCGVGFFFIISPVLWKSIPSATERRPSRLELWFRSTGDVLGMSAVTVVVVSSIIAVVGFAFSISLIRAIVFACVVALVGFFILPIVAAQRLSARRKAARNLWPDVVDVIISALRSGSNIPDALMALSTYSAPVVSAPVVEFSQQYRATGNFTEAVNDLKRRWATAQSDRIIETLRLGRELGGAEMTNVLAALGAHLRSESALRQEVEARQGWIRVAAKIGIIAPVIVIVLLSTRPEAADAYNSPLGFAVVVTGFLVTFLAYKMMTRIGRLDEETRWLS